MGEDVLGILGIDLTGTPMAKWSEQNWVDFQIESQNWSLSQFMHGEQGALVCTAKIVETVPWIDAKYYAATQVMDEARHVEVFAKYLETKTSGHYPINFHLKALLDDIINDSRWDMTYLGMQIMVEGLALAAFGMAYQTTTEPLFKKLLRYVMADEARHVAFGVLSLKEFYEGLSDAEMKDRQEFAYEAAVRMRDRFLQQEVWERMGVDVKQAIKVFDVVDKNEDPFQQLLFSKIVPNCSKLGLLDANGGWLRKRFDNLGVSQFENFTDTGEEYLDFDVAAELAAEADGGRGLVASAGATVHRNREGCAALGSETLPISERLGGGGPARSDRTAGQIAGSSSGGRNSKWRSPSFTSVEAIQPPIAAKCSSSSEPSVRVASSRS